MKILHAIHSLDPAAGGTTHGLRGLVDCLLGHGHATEILVLDDPRSPWLGDWPCPVHAAGRGFGKHGWNPRFDRLARRLVGRFDRVIVHGLWQHHGRAVRRACRRAGVPYAVFPHGMLDAWFAEAYPRKHAFKQLYWWLAEHRVLRDAQAVFFTTAAELEAGRHTFRPFQVRPAIAPFGIAPPPQPAQAYAEALCRREPARAGRRTLLFLGRLHPKKGCDLLVQGFADWRAGLPEPERCDWQLRLVGPREDADYSARLQDLAARHGLLEAGAVVFAEPVQGEAKWQELAHAEALVLPSHQENFGVVIAEALACGTPVLISDKVNGWQAIEQAGAGFAAPDSVAGVIALLRRWQGLDAEARRAHRLAARAHFDRAMSAEVSMAAVLRALEPMPA